MKFNAHPIANSCIEKHILDRRLEDAKPEGRIAAGSWTRGKKEKNKNGVWKTRNGNEE